MPNVQGRPSVRRIHYDAIYTMWTSCGFQEVAGGGLMDVAAIDEVGAIDGMAGVEQNFGYSSPPATRFP